MVLYTCRRCGYSNKIKTHMKKHFMRQTVCSVSNEEVSIAECYEEILGDKYPNVIKSNHLCNQMSSSDVIKCNQNVIPCNQNVIPGNQNVITDVITCKYCNKSFTKRQNKWRHEKTCKEKPGYTKEEVEIKYVPMSVYDDMLLSKSYF